jgi:hypothetical protein
MIAITTSSSISVNATRREIQLGLTQLTVWG